MIWVDADACPRTVRDILCNAARRGRCEVTFVAHQALQIPLTRGVQRVQVTAGFDAADRYISERAQQGDLVVTQDIPLAADCVAGGGAVLTPRGEILDSENVRERLRVRDMMAELRDAGQISGGPPALDTADKARFANAFDRWLTRGRL